MAKGVKKIKWIGNSGVLRDFSTANKILCVKPNQTAPFVVGEWYNETTEDEKRKNITWLWMDQKKRNTFNKTIKPAGVPFGINLPKRLCGSYAFYLEASLYGGHDHRNTGLHVYGKCEEKITASSWSKTKGTADKSEINYGHDLFITLETEGVNGDTLTLKLYSDKKTDSIQTVKAKCINGKIRDAKFTTMPCFMAIPGLPNDIEKFHIKVLDITGKHLTDASGKDKVLSFSIKNKRVPPVFETPTNNTSFRIGETPKEEEVKTEGIITAYFAKEEFTKETSEVDGQHEYKFANTNNNIDKNKIAGIIKKKVDAQVKANKKYAKLDDIKNALTLNSYGEGDPISFNLYKLGANFIKINSAPLEEEVYVVAKTFLLDGKEVSITIKEKEAIVVDADADVTVLEAKENGAELTTLKATIEDGIAKIKVKLRPKADEDLTKWKEKLAGNKKDGTHKYTVKNAFTVSGDLDAIAASIEKKSNAALAPNHIVKKEEIKSLLTEGASYTTTNSFEIPKYKKEKITEMLWLKAECQGDTKKHEGEFLKKDAEYFVIGNGKCTRCEEEISLKQIEDLFGSHSPSKAFREEVVKYLNQFIKQRENTDKPIHLNTCLRKAHFFAQVGAETLGINTDWIVETDAMPYTPANIRNTSIFGDRSGKLERRRQIEAFCADRPQIRLLSFLYASENGFGNGNGNEASGDGYKYRGRGLKQLTGKDNYISASKTFKDIFPDEYVDLEANPDKVKEAKYAVLSAIAYWEKHEIWKTADTLKESTDANIQKIRRMVNGGLAGWKDAKKFFEKGVQVFKVNECSPVKSSSSEKWHDPVDNPISTNYYQNGTIDNISKIWGLFGNEIRREVSRKHTGLDLFAKTGTNIYACVDGTVYKRQWHTGYGNTLTIKVNSPKEFMALKRSDYNIKTNREQLEGLDWSENGDIYLFYAHLDSVNAYTIGQDVKCGDKLGTTGRSGITAGTHAPHLHFEIFCSYVMQSGTRYRINPALFIEYKHYDEQIESDKTNQENEKNRGQIIEFNGVERLP
jgi:predicted chitinase